MYTLRFLLITLCICFFAGHASAQQLSVEQVTSLSLDAAVTRVPEMTLATGDSFYAYFDWQGTSGETSSLGLLNPADGAMGLVLDEEGNALRSWSSSPSIVPLMTVGELHFSYLPDNMGTSSLYSLDGETATLLASFNSDALSMPVAVGGKVYFLQNNHVAAAGWEKSFDLELWATDGTKAGTELVSSIPDGGASLDNALHAGDNGVVIVSNDYSKRTLYYFDPLAGTTEQLSLALGQQANLNYNIASNGNEGTTIAVFGDYVFALMWIGSGDAILRAFHLETGDATSTPLSLGEFPLFKDNHWQMVSNDQHLAIMGSIEDYGTIVFAADAADPLNTEIVYQTAYASLDFGSASPVSMVLQEDKLMFYVQQSEDASNVYSLNLNNGSNISVFSFAEGGYISGEIAATERSVYFSRLGDLPLLRYSRNFGLRTEAALRTQSYTRRNNQMRFPIIDSDEAGILFVGQDLQDERWGIYAWNDAAGSPQNYFKEALPSFRATSKNENPQVLAYKNGELQLINIVDNSFVTVAELPAGFTISRRLVLVDHQLIEISNAATNERRVLFVEDDGSLRRPTLELNGETLTDYYFDLQYGLKNILTGRISPEIGERTPQFPALVEITPDGNLRVRTGGPYSQVPSNAGYSVHPEGAVASWRDWEGPQFNIYIDVWSGNDESYAFEGIMREITPEGAYVMQESCLPEDPFFGTNSFDFVPRGFPQRPISMCEDQPVFRRWFEPTHDLAGRVIVKGYSPAVGLEYFVADPFTGELTLLLDILPGTEGADPNFVARSGTGNMYFTANDGVNGRELWVTNGTTEGTKLVNDLNPGKKGSFPSWAILFEEYLYFSAEVENGRELYRHSVMEEDAEIELAVDIYPGRGSSYPSRFLVLDDELYFTAYGGPDQPLEYYRLVKDDDFSPTPPVEDLALFSAYPNPVLGSNLLTFQAPEGENVVTLDIINAYGAVVRRYDVFHQAITSLSLEELPAATYWLRANYASGRTGLTAVVKI